jgi:hypothetical protein
MLRQVHHDRVAGDVLAHGQGEGGGVVVVDLGRKDFRQAHHLALVVGQFQAHAILARDGFHHPDADQGQGAGQILGQVGDLAALHPGGRFDFVAGDDRARIGGQYFHLHSELP